jgi:hypothetical protein
MSVNIIPIDDKTILIERAGLVTKEQLIGAYSKVLEMDIEYAILDDTNMMVYSNEVMDNEDVQKLVQCILQREIFKHIVSILPEESDRRQFGTELFERLDILHKISFTTSMEAATQRLSELQE